MVESINYSGLSSYIQAIQTTKPAPAQPATFEPVSSKNAAPTRSVQVSIS